MITNGPRNNSFINRIAIIGSYLLTIPYRLFYRGKVHFGKGFITNGLLTISGPGKVCFGDNVCAWARKEPNRIITLSPDAVITIGNNVRLNGAEIQSAVSISIGNNCILGSTTIMDTDFHSINVDRATNPSASVIQKPINIEDNVWIAGRSAVLRGVSIGNNSIVGFGSIVRTNIPDNVIVIGNPAQVVRKLN